MVVKYKLVDKRKQLSGKGTIWDYDVEGHPKIYRVKIAKEKGKTNYANVYYGNGSKTGFRYSGSMAKLKKKINRYFK